MPASRNRPRPRKKEPRRRRRPPPPDINSFSLEGSFDRGNYYGTETRGPRILYHYTDWKAAESIIRSQRFRASAHDCTNDRNELAAADAMILEGARSVGQTVRGKVARRVLGLFYEHYEELRLGASRRAYLVCFSLTRDDPGQWHRYGDGGAGVCLGLRLFDIPPPNLQGIATALMPVEYGESTVRDKVNGWLDEYATIADAAEDIEHNWEVALKALHVSAGAWALTTKEVGWASEQEVRMVFLAREGVAIVPTVETRADGSIKRYVTVPLTGLSRIPIEEFIIGPNQDSAIGCRRASRLLEEIGYPNVTKRVITSTADLHGCDQPIRLPSGEALDSEMGRLLIDS